MFVKDWEDKTTHSDFAIVGHSRCHLRLFISSWRISWDEMRSREIVVIALGHSRCHTRLFVSSWRSSWDEMRPGDVVIIRHSHCHLRLFISWRCNNRTLSLSFTCVCLFVQIWEVETCRCRGDVSEGLFYRRQRQLQTGAAQGLAGRWTELGNQHALRGILKLKS